MLNLYHLKYFADAACMNSLVEAAKINRVSHSAISQAIRSLESILGQELLVHAHRKFELTDAGYLLKERADAVFASMESALHAFGDSQTIHGNLRIGVSHSLMKHIVAKPLAAFCKKHAELNVEIKMGNSSFLAELLQRREIDVGVGIDGPEFARFERQTLREGRFVLAGTLRSRVRECYLYGDKGAEVAELVGYLKKIGRRTQSISAQSWDVIHELCREGLGWGLVPDYITKTSPKLVVKKIPITLPRYFISAFYRSSQNLSYASKLFIDEIAAK